jgi:hypothetical protein
MARTEIGEYSDSWAEIGDGMNLLHGTAVQVDVYEGGTERVIVDCGADAVDDPDYEGCRYWAVWLDEDGVTDDAGPLTDEEAAALGVEVA